MTNSSQVLNTLRHILKADLSGKCATSQYIKSVLGSEGFGFGKS